MENPLGELVAAMDMGIRQGDDTRLIVLTTLLAWDSDSNRGLVSLDGGDETWLYAGADTYWPDVVGAKVIVLRDIWSGKGGVILGPVGSFQEPDETPEALPGKGTVITVSTGYVRVQVGEEQYNARTVTSYVDPSAGDVVALVWDGGSPIAVAEIGTWTPDPPSKPRPPSLSRSGTTLTVSWSKPSNADTTRVRYRYTGGTWVEKGGYTGRSMKISIASGRERQVMIRHENAGGPSPWSSTAEADGASVTVAPPVKPKPKYETITKTISPTSTGTFRDSPNRWDDWNRGRYGFPYSLYQGSQYGSGPLIGLATYGSRITDLRAVEILKIEVRLADAKLGEYRVGNPIRLRLVTNGSRPGGAPNITGGGITTNLSKGQVKWYNLGLTGTRLEQYRTGDLRGLAIDGGEYRALRGRDTSGMSLRITYRRRV